MKIKLLTYNCSAVPILTPYVGERLRRLCAEIRELDPDIVCLQEIGLEAHARILETGLDRWPHRFWRRRWGGLLAGGLALFSKRPYARASFTPYQEQGPWLGYSYIGRLSRKGIMRVDWPDLPLRLLHTHPLADYGAHVKTWTNYAARQERQYREFIEFALREEPGDPGRGLPLAVAGDMNIAPDAPAYRRLVSELRLTDLMAGSLEPSMVREEYFQPSGAIPKRMARLDYIFVSTDGGRLRPARATFALERRQRFDDGVHRTLSDHLGVLGEFHGVPGPGA